MDELEKAHRAQLAELQARLDEDSARVRHRRQQLREVQAEIAAEGGKGETRAWQGAAVQQVHSALCGTVAPTIAALVEQLDSSTPAWGVLNGLLGTLSSSKALLEQAIEERPATRTFDIGDAAGGQEEWDHDGGSDSEWSESHELRSSDARPQGQRSDGGGRSEPWAGRADSRGDGGEESQAMDTEDWWEGSRDSWHAGVRWEACGHGKWERARSSWADAWECERAQDDAAGQPAAARRRLEPTLQAVPAGAAADSGAQGEEAANVLQKQRQHNERVQRIVEAAIEAGVQPLTASGEELVVLDSNQLAAWAEENLPSNGPHW